jgi:hypothetical protein
LGSSFRAGSRCWNRWNDVLNGSIALTAGRRGRWGEDEDLKLKKTIEIHGDKDWDAIAALVPGRTKNSVLIDGVMH